MLVAVYKSSKKADTYLYLPKRDDFSLVPKALIEMFGKPIFVMLVPLMKRSSVALIDSKKLQAELEQHGFYLQIPPPVDNLLKQHRAQQNQSK